MTEITKIILGFIVAATVIFLIIMYLVPVEKGGKRKKFIKTKEEPTDKEKDLEAKIVRLEKHIEGMKHELDASLLRQRQKEKEIEDYQLQLKAFQEKLAQEKSWREKEQDTMDKRNKEVAQYKQEHLKLEQSVEEEHAVRLRLEHELKEMKREFEIANTDRRSLSYKVQGYETTLEQHKKELIELKRENTRLKDKNEAVEWVAKPQYEKLEALLREKEKEIERISRDRKQESNPPTNTGV